jgi:serine/threonine protein kinase
MNANAITRAVDDAHAAHEGRSKLIAPGTCVAGKYIICDVLGIGGSAIVYAAEQLGLKRVVAFKHYPASGALAAQLLERFEREAQLLARVHHENVVAVYHAGSMPDGSPYLVVQRLSGESLATHLLSGPLPIVEAVALTHQVLAALSALSDAGITHRDVKPENLVLDRLPDGRTVLKLVDFGIAKATFDEASRALDEMVGTPRYMAPEQVRGEKIDGRCDQYALGVTLYQMLTGRTPHTGETLQELATATLLGPITPVRVLRRDCPEGLEQIVMTALAREPSNRFASAHEMKRALDRWQAGHAPLLGKPAWQAHDAHLEDTVRIRTLKVLPSSARANKIKQRGALALGCLLALGGLLLAQELRAGSAALPISEQVAAHIVSASELLPRDLLRETGRTASALAEQTSASLSELWTRARASADELLTSRAQK